MATQITSGLPHELWARVLENLCGSGDRTEAWTSHRYVCRAFKTAIEQVFREEHLPKTFILYPLGEDWDEDEGKLLLDANFEFSHLSEDKNTAFFKIDALENYFNQMRPLLKDAVEDELASAPNHFVQVRHDLNDTPIPEIKVDYETFLLSCDWRGLYTRFYGEESIYDKKTQAWVKGQESKMSSIRAMIESGTMDMGKALEHAIGSFAKGSDENRKMARRCRIKRQIKEQDHFVWSFEGHGDAEEEKEILETLAKRRQWASMEEYSDEQGSGEEDDEDDEDEEEDEWEDEEEDDVAEEAT